MFYKCNLLFKNSNFVALFVMQFFTKITQIINDQISGNEQFGVTFMLNGGLQTATTDNNGVASLDINLSPNTYEITSLNPVTDETKLNKIKLITKSIIKQFFLFLKTKHLIQIDYI